MRQRLDHEGLGFRRLGPADVPALALLQGVLGGEGLPEEELARDLRLPVSRAWGCCAGNELLAALLAWLVVEELQILQLVVRPDQRRRGLASALLALATEEAGAEGAEVMLLEVRSGNEAALRLYATAGFVSDGLRRGFYGNGEDALLMRKVLG